MNKPVLKKMNPKDKKTWTTALRSGKYKQGSGQLVNYAGDKHCCLGVAQCAIGGRQPKRTAGLLRSGRFGLTNTVQVALAAANDGCVDVDNEFKNLGVPKPRLKNGKATFGAIANWIDKYL